MSKDWILGGLLLACCSAAYAQDAARVPKHLAIARELVENIKPENNQYVLGGEFVSFPGDALSTRYAMKADCSGFLLAMFERASYPTRSQMTFLKWSPTRKRARAEDFLYSIEHEKGYRHIRKVEEMKPGDLLAHAMLNIEDQRQTGTTGHVFLINSAPRKIAARRPVVNGTTQYEVAIIDSNTEHVGDDDSRLQYPANKLEGLGQGTIRVYADANGELVGWARTFRNTKLFFSYSPRFPSETKLRKAAIGRPTAGLQ